jgi:PAS domain S-box-containing protein
VRRYHDGRIDGWRDNYVYKLPSGEIVAVYADVTEQKVTEEELNLKAYLLDNATDSILLHDLAGNVIFANETACSSLGYTREEMVGLNLLKTIPEEEAKLWDSRIKERLEKGPIIFETNLRRKDGSIRNAEVHTRIIDVNGRKMVFSVSRDISERQKMEKSLLIADRLSALGEMALGFSHELNNPLTAVVGYSQLILDDKRLPEKMRTDIGHIHSQAQRAANIIRNFMLFAQKRPAIKQPTELNNVITNVLNLREFQLKNEKIEVVLKLRPGLAAVMADASQLQQVFLDIVMNAEYFMLKAHNKGTLTITTERDGGMVRACFADDGEGIARENLTRIFNPFFTTKEVGQGTGLGLAISHSIISEHGGRIYAESEPGQGATIIVELPVARG